MISQQIVFFLILIPTIVIHELSHAYTANKLGDPTAKYAGRLSFNPLVHIDLFGTILLPFVLAMSGSPLVLGWAKPVPYNPLNLHNPKRDSLLVALAGPISNFSLALICALVYHLLTPVYGSTLYFLINGFGLLNIVLGVFNLIPIPPLDGSRILAGILPYPYDQAVRNLEPYGIILLIIFLLSPASNAILSVGVQWISNLLGLPVAF